MFTACTNTSENITIFQKISIVKKIILVMTEVPIM